MFSVQQSYTDVECNPMHLKQEVKALLDSY